MHILCLIGFLGLSASSLLATSIIDTLLQKSWAETVKEMPTWNEADIMDLVNDKNFSINEDRLIEHLALKIQEQFAPLRPVEKVAFLHVFDFMVLNAKSSYEFFYLPILERYPDTSFTGPRTRMRIKFYEAFEPGLGLF